MYPMYHESMMCGASQPRRTRTCTLTRRCVCVRPCTAYACGRHAPAVMSSNGDTPNVLRGVTHGACDYLIKPVRLEELRNLWQHVVRRKRQVGRRRIWSARHASPVGAREVLGAGGGCGRVNR